MCVKLAHKTIKRKELTQVKTSDDKTERVVSRISVKLKREFEECLSKNDEKQSEVIRKCVINYIRNTKRS